MVICSVFRLQIPRNPDEKRNTAIITHPARRATIGIEALLLREEAQTMTQTMVQPSSFELAGLTELDRIFTFVNSELALDRR